MDSTSPSQLRIPRKLVVALIVGSVAAIAYFQFGDYLTIERLAQHEAAIKNYQLDHPLLVYGLAFLMYVVAAGCSLPIAAPMTIAFACLFGFWPALLLVSFASTAGATIAFLLSRYFFGAMILNRFESQLEKFNDSLRREGAFYLFTLRLIPAIPFWLINVVMGLTPISVRTYWWVSQLGMLPGTCAYVYSGTTLPSLEQLSKDGVGSAVSPELIFAFVLLGVFPLIAKKVIERVRRRSESDETVQES